jgi:hypothetical protein
MRVTFPSFLVIIKLILYEYAVQLAPEIDVHACRQGPQPCEPTTLERGVFHAPDLQTALDFAFS